MIRKILTVTAMGPISTILDDIIFHFSTRIVNLISAGYFVCNIFLKIEFAKRR